jgi:heat shock protein HslJ
MGPVNAAEQDIRGTQWIVLSFKDAAKIDSARTSFALSADGKFATTIGCNRMMGAAKVEGTAMSIGSLAATRMACPEPLMKLENAWGVALEAVRSYKIEDGKLRLLDGTGAELAVLAQAPDPAPK